MASPGMFSSARNPSGGGSVSAILRQARELIGEARRNHGRIGIPSVFHLPVLRAAHRERLNSKMACREGRISPDPDFIRKSLKMLRISGASYAMGATSKLKVSARSSSLLEVDLVAAKGKLDPESIIKIGLGNGLGLQVPPHFILLDHASRSLVVAVRGTRSFSDVYTNLVCRPCPFIGGYAHEGMASSARSLWNHLGTYVKKIVPDGYSLKFVGHSLGGGIAILTALHLLTDPLEANFKRKTDISCWAYAPPPVFKGVRKLVPRVRTQVNCFVNRDDVVPTLSFAKVGKVFEHLRMLDRVGWMDRWRALKCANPVEFLENKMQGRFSRRSDFEDLELPGQVFWMWGKGDFRLVKTGTLSEVMVSDTMIMNHMVRAYEQTLLSVLEGAE